MTDIIWDWNGTLLNDLHYCISTINTLLRERNLPLLDHLRYREVFSFPVKDYYLQIGFDFSKEDFEGPAAEFTDRYRNGVHTCALHEEAVSVLGYFRNIGVRQFVLSAMEQELLEHTLKQKEIFQFFEGVAGLNDHFAVSKVERGHQLMETHRINPAEAVMIGDTTHDYEVANALGMRCILIADGHQSVERLRQTSAVVLNTLSEIISSNSLNLPDQP